MTELMAPAGSYESLQAAINAGAESVYFGVGHLNMRSRSANFGFEDLPKVASICNKNGVKSYLTVNTVVYDEDLKDIKQILDRAKEAGISAVICMDISAIEYARLIGLEVHMSTQVNISNIQAVKFYSKYADVVVLARELKLEQIESICLEIKKQKITGPSGKLVEIEVFVHGAMCVAISGKCYMSLGAYNSSANRGACLQNCRRAYKVTDTETGIELEIDNKYVMSPKDMCTIGMLDKLVKAGVSIFKIEGRGRSPDYVKTVVSVYKEAIDAIEKQEYTQEKANEWEKKLKTTFNRGFWKNGYYMGKKLGEWSNRPSSQSTLRKEYVGYVTNYYKEKNVAVVKIEARILKKGEDILIIGPTTGVVEDKVVEIHTDDGIVESAGKGAEVSFKTELVRTKDKVYAVVKVEED